MDWEKWRVVNDTYKVVTRGSKLALIQTNIMTRRLCKMDPSLKFHTIKVKSFGDINKNKIIFSVDEKGIFEKEVDRAVLEERADFAVHSVKDLPTELDSELVIASILSLIHSNIEYRLSHKKANKKRKLKKNW